MASTDRPVATGQLDAYPIPVPLLRSSPAAPQSDSLRLDPFLFPLPGPQSGEAADFARRGRDPGLRGSG